MIQEQGSFAGDIVPYRGVWPDYNLSNNQVLELVEESRTTPLRELIGHVVFQEGKKLLRAYRPDPNFKGEVRHEPDHERRKFYRDVGGSILYSCALVREGIAAANGLVASIHNKAVDIFPDNPDLGIYIATFAGATERYAPGKLEEALTSFAIDPSGFDLLDRDLKSQKESAQVFPTPLQTARAEGFERGVER